MYLFRPRSGYLPVPVRQESPGSSSSKSVASTTSRVCRLLVLPAVAVVSCALGFSVGTRTSVPACSNGDSAFLQPTKLDIAIPTINTAFKYNRTFSEDPWNNSITEEAWESIVPVGQGSVRYPAAMPQVYTLSVVHQLHCLWSIHRNYYTSLRPQPADHDDSDESMARHMRHCFDYLRQSLMCAADATLEPVDPALGGVTGWHNPRVCRDYNALAAWAAAHRVSNLRGFLQTPGEHSHGKQ